jgi:hypothetical protein
MQFQRSNINMNSFQEGDNDYNPNSSQKEEMVRLIITQFNNLIYLYRK